MDVDGVQTAADQATAAQQAVTDADHQMDVEAGPAPVAEAPQQVSELPTDTPMTTEPAAIEQVKMARDHAAITPAITAITPDLSSALVTQAEKQIEEPTGSELSLAPTTMTPELPPAAFDLNPVARVCDTAAPQPTPASGTVSTVIPPASG